MDQKTWLWRKRSAEKTIVTNGDESQAVPPDKDCELENSLKLLNEKLASTIEECSVKDKLLQDYEKTSEDAKTEKLKLEEEIENLMGKLDEATHKYSNASEQLVQLNSALKDSMDQLNLIRSEQEQTIQEAVQKENKELEKSYKKLDEKLSECNKSLGTLTVENSYLTKALLVKEKLIEDLNDRKCRKEAEFEALISRLDSVEKENAFLRYEFRTLEKELDVKNEEIEYNRRSSEAIRKKNLENGKKIKKLEGECARLRELTRKRLHGNSAVFANTKGEVERNHTNNMLRRKGMKGDMLHGQMIDLENENTILKECLGKKDEEISLLRLLLEKLDLTSSNSLRDEHSSCSNEITHYGSRDSDLISKSIEASEMSLLDDFDKMEKLAIISVDPKDLTTTEPLPFRHNEFEQESKTKEYSWLKDVRNLILEQHKISNRSLNELLEDIRTSLDDVTKPELRNLLPVSGYIAWKSPASSPKLGLHENRNGDLISSDLNKSVLKIIELVHKLEESSKEAECKIHAILWKNPELHTKLGELVHTCENLKDGKIALEKFVGDVTCVVEWVVENSTSYQDNYTVRDLFIKNLGESGPGTALGLESVQKLMLEMEKIHSISQVEIKGLKNELNSIKSSGKSLNNEALEGELQQKTASLESNIEISGELKRDYENQIEELKLINRDIDTQLTVTKSELNEALKKLSSVEVELDNKSHCCEELKGTCVDLQLQLESSNQNSNNNDSQEDLLQTGMKITKASEKLAECEETILKLGNHLKSLSSAKELSVVDQVLSITDMNTSKNKKLNQRPSLRDQMLCEDTNVTELNTPLVNPRSRALVVSGKKQSGGFGFLKKLIYRRTKKNSIYKSSSLW